jgi:hypothetical protein
LNIFRAGYGLEVFEEGLDNRPAKSPHKPALILEENVQHPGDREDNLAVRDIQKECLPHPLAPFLQPLGMTRGAETSGAAGKHQNPLLATAGTAYSGKTTLGIEQELTIRKTDRQPSLSIN